MAYKKRSLISLFLRDKGWFCLLFILVGVGLGYVSKIGIEQDSQLSSKGIETTGEVTHKQSSSRKGNSRSYSVSYYFSTPQDPYTNGNQSVSLEYYDSIAEGERVPVRYLPSDPKVSEIEFGSPVVHRRLGLFLGLVLILSGVGGGAYLIRRARGSIWLRERGEVRKAKVTSHAIDGRESDKANKGRALWCDTKDIEGRSLVWTLPELPPVGTEITVFSDSEGKLKSVWEGDVGSR
jgi:hypothetical protein